MSELTTIARPYAYAAFEFARDANKLQQWEEYLALLAMVAADQELKELLEGPKLSRNQRAEILLQICDGKLDANAENLVKLLAENNRLSVFGEIAEQFSLLKAEHEGSIEAIAYSAKELPAEQQEKIITSLQNRLGKKVELKCEIDESLIGGAVIKAGDLVIDGSIKSRLNKLNSTLRR